MKWLAQVGEWELGTIIEAPTEQEAVSFAAKSMKIADMEYPFIICKLDNPVIYDVYANLTPIKRSQ